MVAGEFSLFANPEGLIVGVGIIVFALSLTVMNRFFGGSKKGLNIIIAFVITVIASWSMWKNDFYGFENGLAILIYILIGVICLKIIWMFLHGVGTSVGYVKKARVR